MLWALKARLKAAARSRERGEVLAVLKDIEAALTRLEAMAKVFDSVPRDMRKGAFLAAYKPVRDQRRGLDELRAQALRLGERMDEKQALAVGL